MRLRFNDALAAQSTKYPKSKNFLYGSYSSISKHQVIQLKVNSAYTNHNHRDKRNSIIIKVVIDFIYSLIIGIYIISSLIKIHRKLYIRHFKSTFTWTEMVLLNLHLVDNVRYIPQNEFFELNESHHIFNIIAYACIIYLIFNTLWTACNSETMSIFFCFSPEITIFFRFDSCSYSAPRVFIRECCIQYIMYIE